MWHCKSDAAPEEIADNEGLKWSEQVIIGPNSPVQHERSRLALCMGVEEVSLRAGTGKYHRRLRGRGQERILVCIMQSSVPRVQRLASGDQR